MSNPFEPPKSEAAQRGPEGEACPGCGEPMEPGHLRSAMAIQWVPDEDKTPSFRLRDHDVVSTSSLLKGAFIEGLRCVGCGHYQFRSRRP